MLGSYSAYFRVPEAEICKEGCVFFRAVAFKRVFDMLNVSRNGFGAEGNIALIDALVVCDFAEDNAYRLTVIYLFILSLATPELFSPKS